MKKKMNLPNKLTVLRICLVPVILLIGMLTPKSDTAAWFGIPQGYISVCFYVSCLACAAVFIAASVTDMLDGKIARREGIVTDFGKFLDPVADKFMVIGAMFVIFYKFQNLQLIMIIALIVVVFRELAVTAIRMVVAGGNVVVAANLLGKVKTVTQIVAISTAFIEPALQWLIRACAEKIIGEPLAWRTDIVPLTWITIALALVMTVWSGINYIVACWKYLDPEK